MNNDLISRSALLEELKNRYDEAKQREAANYEWETFESSGIESAMLCVENFPAVDAEPVRHGEWSNYRINGYDGLHPVYETQCSLCGGYVRFTYRFCPHCCARMNGGTKTNG